MIFILCITILKTYYIELYLYKFLFVVVRRCTFTLLHESWSGNVSRRKVTVVMITYNGNVFLVEIMMKTSRVTNFTDYQDSLRLQRAHELVSISLLSSCVLSSCVFQVALMGCVTVNRDSKKKRTPFTFFYERKFYLCSRNTCRV